MDIFAVPMEKFASWTPVGPKHGSSPQSFEESQNQPVPVALWSYAPFFAAVRKHALAEIETGGPDNGSGPTDALTKFWPMALRNDKEIILAALAAAKDKKRIFELAGASLQSDHDVASAAGVEIAPRIDEETRP